MLRNVIRRALEGRLATSFGVDLLVDVLYIPAVCPADLDAVVRANETPGDDTDPCQNKQRNRS